MTVYSIKASGRDAKANATKEVTHTFDVDTDEAAMAHCETIAFALINSQLVGAFVAAVSRADGSPLGTINLHDKSWNIGAIHPDDEIVYAGYSRNQMQIALNLITNRVHWKYPFDAIVPVDADQDLISAAAAFFCGSPVDFQKVENGYRVTGPGYFECIGS